MNGGEASFHAPPVHLKEKQAEAIAHVLDDAFRLPGIGMRVGIDPLVGLIPVFGDALVTAMGIAILLNARQLRVPPSILARMLYNLALNGLIGSIPAFGDLFSFWFKSHSKNAALLIRAIAHGEKGACSLRTPTLSAKDIGLVLALAVPLVAAVGYTSFVFWDRGITIF